MTNIPSASTVQNNRKRDTKLETYTAPVLQGGDALDLRRPYVLSGQRPEPDVGNLLIIGAHAFTVTGWTYAYATRPR